MNIINVGFIGLGNVGSKLASNIMKGNFQLFVNDLDKKKSAKLIEEGAKYKKVIFCEKPLTYDLQSGIEIVKMAQNLNKLLLVNYMRRWDKFYLECKDILDNYELGRLETMVVYADTALYMNSSHMLDLIVYFGGDVFSLVGYIDKINKPRVVNGKKDFGAIALITHKNGVRFKKR